MRDVLFLIRYTTNNEYYLLLIMYLSTGPELGLPRFSRYLFASSSRPDFVLKSVIKKIKIHKIM